MRGKQFCAAFLVTVYITAFECKLEIFGLKKYNMAKFLQTKLPIWTFYTTSGGNAECEVEVVQTITQKSAALMRYFYDGSKKVASPQLGTFDQRHKDYMTVRTPGGYYLQERIVYAKHDYSCAVIEVTMKLCDNIFLSMEKLLYMTRKYGCAVIMVTQAQYGREPYYELRVWESFLKQRPNLKCVREFQKHAHKGQTIYEPFCHHILLISLYVQRNVYGHTTRVQVNTFDVRWTKRRILLTHLFSSDGRTFLMSNTDGEPGTSRDYFQSSRKMSCTSATKEACLLPRRRCYISTCATGAP
ncbi:uncharacterized protein LOC119167322 isoform X2 [Rhipicephalus microplus]|uniref:uncharacterized protein LOC119167322 isoform X2 n=1 Tax=Rhipicephalus microplus TaxID=6941 RepID=UPI003F6BFEDB